MTLSNKRGKSAKISKEHTRKESKERVYKTSDKIAEFGLTENTNESRLKSALKEVCLENDQVQSISTS